MKETLADKLKHRNNTYIRSSQARSLIPINQNHMIKNNIILGLFAYWGINVQ